MRRIVKLEVDGRGWREVIDEIPGGARGGGEGVIWGKREGEGYAVT